MKKLIIVLFLVVGFTHAASVFKLKPAKQELTETVVKTVVTPQYSSDITPFCPRDLPYPVSTQVVTENGVEIYKHCEKCRTGVYTEHKDEETRSCSYCGAKE